MELSGPMFYDKNVYGSILNRPDRRSLFELFLPCAIILRLWLHLDFDEEKRKSQVQVLTFVLVDIERNSFHLISSFFRDFHYYLSNYMFMVLLGRCI